MRNISSEHANFKTSLANNQASISSIQGSQVSMDQYNRSWSVRIMELQLTAEDEANPFRLVETVYNKVFLPILTGALSEDLIPRIPSCDQLYSNVPTSSPPLKPEPSSRSSAVSSTVTTRLSASASRRSTPPRPPTLEPGRDPATPTPSMRTCPQRFSRK
jgi:hypothetical protein